MLIQHVCNDDASAGDAIAYHCVSNRLLYHACVMTIMVIAFKYTVRSRTKKHLGLDRGTLGFFIFLFFLRFLQGFFEGPRPGYPFGFFVLEINEFPFRLCCPAGGLDLGKSLFSGK